MSDILEPGSRMGVSSKSSTADRGRWVDVRVSSCVFSCVSEQVVPSCFVSVVTGVAINPSGVTNCTFDKTSASG